MAVQTTERPRPRRATKALRPWPESVVPVIRERAEADLYFFCREVMGHTLLEPEPHGALCSWLTRPSPGKVKLALAPRGSFKSTIVSQDYPTWSIVRDPAHMDRILIDSDIRANSKKIATYIRRQFEANPRLRQLWGNLRADPGWTDEYFTVTRTVDLKEPTIHTSGIDQVVVMLHFDKIVVDDLVNNTNVNTKEQLEKTKEHYRLLFPLRELLEINPEAEIVLVGTRWDDADLYGDLLRQHSGLGDEELRAVLATGEVTFPGLDVFFRSAYHTDGTPLFSKYTEAFLNEQRDRLEAYLFAANYLNDPVPVVNATFRREYFQYWDRLPENLLVFMIVDPALSQTRGSDRSAIIVAATDGKKYVYVLEAWADRVLPHQLINKMFELNDAYLPQQVGLEVVAFQKVLKFMLYDEMAKRQEYFGIRELAPDTRKTKEMRIRGLQPRYQAGTILHRRGVMADLELELLRFPRGQHDDLIDALAYLPQIMAPAPVQSKTGATPEEYVPENDVTGY